MSNFLVRANACEACLYTARPPAEIAHYESTIADLSQPGMFRGHVVCAMNEEVCCRPFWDAHRNHFLMGQVAQRLDAVEFVDPRDPEPGPEDAS